MSEPTQEQIKEFWVKLPFKRTIIGEERSMPNGTVVWFITDDEYSEIRKSFSKKKTQP